MASKSDAEAKFRKVLKEFKAGTLKSSNGKKVTNRRQAIAIALSEARQINPQFGRKSALGKG